MPPSRTTDHVLAAAAASAQPDPARDWRGTQITWQVALLSSSISLTVRFVWPRGAMIEERTKGAQSFITLSIVHYASSGSLRECILNDRSMAVSNQLKGEREQRLARELML